MYFGSLTEEFLIIVLDSKTGKLKENMTPHLSIGLIGSILLDLILKGRLTIEKNNLLIVDDTPIDDDILNEALTLIIEEEEILPILYWIRKLRYHFNNLDKIILEKLVEKGVLTKEKIKKFLIFSDTRYYFANIKIKEIIKQKIQQVVNNKEESDHYVLAKLSLIYATNCTTEIFSENELEEKMNQIRNIAASDEIGQSVATAINNIIDALMRTLIISSSYAY